MLRLLFSVLILSLSLTAYAGTDTPGEGITFTHSPAKSLSLCRSADGTLTVNIPARAVTRLIAAGQVTYRDFGAIGTDTLNDSEAIAAAHAFANENGLPVKAHDEDTYYFNGQRQTAIIATDTDFGKARFVIDDTAVEDRTAPIFRVVSRLQPHPVTGITRLKRNQRKLRLRLPETCLVTVEDDSVRRYIRKGRNQNAGKPQTDVFIVDRKGRVDMDAPIIWDFNRISAIRAVPIDPTTLHLTGGRFTTIANQEPSAYNYYARNLEIQRSNVVVKGIEHRIEGEGETGAPYRGFLHVRDCAYVTIEDALLTGHKTYWTIGSAGQRVPMGSYDFSAGRALNVSLINCRQTNDINDRTYWGLMASNFCKNLRLDGCSVSRFDAHMGVANVVLRNSTFGHMGIKAIGSGTLLVENSTVNARHLVSLRPDYGSTWRGALIVRNCTLVPPGDGMDRSTILGGYNNGKHDFGYTCYLPETVTIENLTVKRAAGKAYNGKGTAVFDSFQPAPGTEDAPLPYAYVLPQKVVLKNITIANGIPLRLSNNPALFKKVKVVRQ